MYEDSPIPGMHPRQAAVLLEVPEEAWSAVKGRAYLLQNLGGGIYSSCLRQAKNDLDRVNGDLEALEQMDRRDNHAAMSSCGCSACARDAKKMEV